MNRRDYRKIAKKHKVSVAQVKKDIGEAINMAYEKPALHATCVPRKGEVPTVNEFLSYTSNRVKALQCLDEQESNNKNIK